MFTAVAKPPTAPSSEQVCPRVEWLPREEEHRERVAAWADAFVERRSRGLKHPVEDFLFTYYTFSPAKLKQWVPPLGVVIEIEPADLTQRPWLERAPFVRMGNRLALDSAQMPEMMRARARDIAALCRAILDRPPRFRCHGLHEWAMVYRQTRAEVRHSGYELRLSPEELARFVELQAICCSHYDAFRFFTPEARPLNALQPTLEQRVELEQGGCLHTNMDLYKWSAKLWPWIGSDLVGRAFSLAREGRNLDMRASPYDLREIGYEPIAIETPVGREEYVAAQRELAERAVPLREELWKAAEEMAGP
jgi:hypothetical protein